MRIVCISDTHCLHRKIDVPPGDLLIHAGDLTVMGELKILDDFNDWLGELPHRYKIVVFGNHDISCDPGHIAGFVAGANRKLTNAIVLTGSFCTVGGVKIWGSPVSPAFHGWAFGMPRDSNEIAAHWAAIPQDIDVLVTHGPPLGRRDRVQPHSDSLGCSKLSDRLRSLPHLRLHVFGHVHGGYGVSVDGGVVSVNAAQVDEAYRVRPGRDITVEWSPLFGCYRSPLTGTSPSLSDGQRGKGEV